MSCRPNPRVLVIEPWLTGHHGPYLRWILPAVRAAGAQAVLAVDRRERRHPFYGEVIRLASDVLEFDFPQGASHQSSIVSLRFALDAWRACQEAIKEARGRGAVDAVFVPYMDAWIHAAAVLGSPFGATVFSGIAMGTTFHQSRLGLRGPRNPHDTIKRLAFRRVASLGTLSSLLVIDPTVREVLAADGDRVPKVRYLKDPVRIPQRSIGASLLVEPATTAFPILVYGMLSPRKGIEQLLNACAHRDCPLNVEIILAGAAGPSLQSLLERGPARTLLQQNRLHTITRPLSEAEEAGLLNVARAVWAGYLGHLQMSAAIVHAGMWSIPTICAKEGLMGWLVSKHQTGICVDPRNERETIRAITRLASEPDLCAELGASGLATFGSHTLENAAGTITAEIEGMLKLSKK